MPNFEVLRNESHLNLKVDARIMPGLGYDTGAVMLLPNEIVEAQRFFPLVFRKHAETGEFFLTALFGFEEKQNLFMGASGEWLADYMPLSFAKGPFVISFEGQADKSRKAVLSIDMDDPRVDVQDGEAIFTEDGKPTPYLDTINHSLFSMDQGIRQLKPMVDLFLEFNLIEPLNLDVTFESGQSIHLNGAFAIDEEKLKELGANELEKLSQAGILGSAYFIAGSLNNIGKLVALKNAIDGEK